MKTRNLWRSAMRRLCTLAWPIVSLFGSKAKFTFVHRMNLWGNPESASGDGSTMAYTENLRTQLPVLFRKYGVRSVFDAPCGDYHWFRHVAREGITYIGGDIVAPMAERNQRSFGDDHTSFTCFDITRTPFPDADIWVCRDCMFHLPTADVMRAFENFSASNIPYVLTTSHIDTQENTGLPRKGFRMLNLELSPYEFPPPLESIEDWIPGFPRRIMGLWRREQVRDAMQRWKRDASERHDG